MFFKPTEVQNIQREKRDENGTIPASRKGVRNKQESLSDLLKNHCPESAGISVRFRQESLSGMARNHCPDWARICRIFILMKNLPFFKLFRSLPRGRIRGTLLINEHKTAHGYQ